jgi:hypothetical protein
MIKLIDLQYADDLGWIGNCKKSIQNIEQEITEKLKLRDLLINKSKTEKINVNQNSDDNWKKCKYLGSFLDTKKDLSHRKQMSMIAFHKYNKILQSKKINLKTRMRIFDCYISSIFLYNSELWTITQKIENEIDVFQRKLLRKILKIRYPFIISNENLLKRTKAKLWSQNIKVRRLKWTGHLLRLPQHSPARLALDEITNNKKINKRTNKKTWIKQIDKDLKSIDGSFSVGCGTFKVAIDIGDHM